MVLDHRVSHDEADDVHPPDTIALANIMASSTAPGPTDLWDLAPNAHPTDDALTEPVSTAPASIFADSLAPPSSPPSSISFSVSESQSSFRNQGKPPSRLSPKHRHRKRQRLNPNPPPFDPDDYWMQFDNQDTNAKSLDPEPKSEGKRRAPPPVPKMAVTQAAHQMGGTLAREGAIDNTTLDGTHSDDDEAHSVDFGDLLSIPIPDFTGQADLSATSFRLETGSPQPGSLVFVQSPTLPEPEQRRLMAIALGSSPDDAILAGAKPSGFTMDQVTSEAPHPRPTPSRKTSKTSLGGEEGASRGRSGERATHNDIERKYRTNLKDKIAELRDAVPALKAIPESTDSPDQEPAAPKVSKGTVLTKATEYIRYLERRNRTITLQHQDLSRRLAAYEQLLSPTARGPFEMGDGRQGQFEQ